MKATSVRYERLVSRGNYEHEKAAVEVAVSEGEKAEDAMRAARKFVESTLGISSVKTPSQAELARAQSIIQAAQDAHDQGEIPF